VQLKNIWAAIDAGEAINLDGLANQTEGGLIQAASWTLMEEVKFDEHHINTLDWGSYPIFRFSDIPQVEVAVINRPDTPPLGGGEASVAPASAAIANAIYKACGKRVRDLPIRAEKIRG
jgi:CO/xanthine dehydrogenase Mo-binding subunit